MAPPVRLGLIGAGRWGRIYLHSMASRANVNGMADHAGIHLAAVASGKAETAALLPPACVLYDDWRRMLAHPGLDGIVIATPPHTHVPIALAVLAQGLAALVEKPLCLDPHEARRLRDQAGRLGAVVAVDHIHLFAPAFRRLKQMLPQIGPIRSVEGRAGNHGPYRRDASVLWDWGPHDVAMAVDLLGSPPDRVTARVVDQRLVADGIGQNVALDLRFGAVRADFVIGTLMDKTRRFRVVGDNGVLVYDDLVATKLTLDGEGVAIDPAKPLDCVIDDFVRRIRARDRDLAPLELAVTVTDILSACAAQLG